MKTMIIRSCSRCVFAKHIRRKNSRIVYLGCTLKGGKPVENMFEVSSFCPLFAKFEIDYSIDTRLRGYKRLSSLTIKEVK